MQTCHNCGLPSDCASNGRQVTLRLKPENGSQRERKHTVWCHSDECAIQALAIAQYGPATHKWPITLAQFRAMNPLPAKGRSDRTEMGFQVTDSINAKNANFEIMGLPHMPAISVRKGRPKRWNSEAERLRAYRARQRNTEVEVL